MSTEPGQTALAGANVIERLQADGHKVTADNFLGHFAADIDPVKAKAFAKRMGADTIEVASGHGAMISHPEETYERIVSAANAVA